MQIEEHRAPYLRGLKTNVALAITCAFLLLCSTSARAITLACVAEDGFTFPLAIDEAQNEIIAMGVQANNVRIAENMIMFDLEMRGGTWPHILSRLTGELLVKSPRSGTWMPPYRCQVAAPKF